MKTTQEIMERVRELLDYCPDSYCPSCLDYVPMHYAIIRALNYEDMKSQESRHEDLRKFSREMMRLRQDKLGQLLWDNGLDPSQAHKVLTDVGPLFYRGDDGRWKLGCTIKKDLVEILIRILDTRSIPEPSIV
jgi:hypothetical protein